MLCRGQCAALGTLSSYRRRPRLSFPAASFCLMAVSDHLNSLAEEFCYVISEGYAYEGSVVVWRYPCHTTHDVEILTAIRPPPGHIFSENSIVLSRRGRVNSGMAGGDLDGDFNCVTFYSKMVSLVQATEAAVRAIAIADFEHEVAALLTPTFSEFSSTDLHARYDEYQRHSFGLKTMNVKGLVCAMAERAAHPALRATNALKDGSLHSSIRFACLSHKAMDVPKKYKAQDVFDAGKTMLADLQQPSRYVRGKAKRPLRSTATTRRQLRLSPAATRLSKTRAFGHFESILRDCLLEVPLGQVWLAPDQIVLGREAGRLVMEHLLALPTQEKYFRRDASVTLLDQLAKLILHKLGRRLGRAPVEWLDLPMVEIHAALKACRRKEVLSLRSLYDSRLP